MIFKYFLQVNQVINPSSSLQGDDLVVEACGLLQMTNRFSRAQT